MRGLVPSEKLRICDVVNSPFTYSPYFVILFSRRNKLRKNSNKMKPSDLKRPFRWQHRKVLLEDGILHVPDFYKDYSDFTFPGWESPEIFGNSNPVHVEYCSGNGKWILERAIANPDINWVAVEMRFDRIRKIWAKLKNHELKNLLIVCGEACLSTEHYFPSNSVAATYVNFPDPWPKDRHAKHRLIQKPFVDQVARILKPDGRMTLVTDDKAYCQQMIEEFTGCSTMESIFPVPYFVTEWPDYGTSYFDELWRSKGETIHYQQYKKKAASTVC